MKDPTGKLLPSRNSAAAKYNATRAVLISFLKSLIHELSPLLHNAWHNGSCNTDYPKKLPWSSLHKILFPKHVFQTLFMIRERSWKVNLWSRLNNFLLVHPEPSFPLNWLKETENVRGKNLFSANPVIFPVSHRQVGTRLYQAAF